MTESRSHTPPRRRPRLVWPLLLIGLGALLLLDNFRLLPPGTLAALVQLWPVALILLGLEILLGARSGLVVLLACLATAAALTWSAVRAQSLPAGEPRPLLQSRQAAEQASVPIAVQAGELSVSALGASDFLMEGQADAAAGAELEQRYTVRDGRGELNLRQTLNPLVVPFLQPAGQGFLWEVRLNPRVPLQLNAATGAGRATLDVAQLRVSRLRLKTGVGQTTVILPASGQLSAELDTGVGEVTLIVPRDVPMRMQIDGALTRLTIPASLTRQDGLYATPGFSTEGDYLDLTIRAGIGQITVRYP